MESIGGLRETLAWAAQQGGAAQPQSPMPMFVMFGVIGLLFYFLLMRPQRQEQRRRDEMLNQIARGDGVITAGGIHGIVESVDKEKNIVTVVVAPKISLRFSRGSIATVLPKKGKDEAANGTENRG